MAIIVTRNVTSADDQAQQMLNLFYPVGSYYETSDTSFDPNTAWGGTWVEDTDGRVLVAQNTGTFTTVGDTGGEETHTLVTSEMPNHSHTIFANDRVGGGDYATPDGGNYSGTGHSYSTSAVGGNGAHNNLQPYIVVKRWHRTA